MADVPIIYTGEGIAKDLLKQAVFFFGKMNEVKDNENMYEFKAYSFAMLVSARCVTLALQKELNKNPDFNKWYEPKRKEFEKNFEHFLKARNLLMHKFEPFIKRHNELTITDFINVTDAIFIELRAKDGTTKRKLFDKEKKPVKPTGIQLKRTWQLKNRPDLNFIQETEKYINYLSEIVEEAYNNFKHKEKQR